MYSKSKYNELNTPIYQDLKDIVLIGVCHRVNLKRWPARTKHFLQQLSLCKHLIMEGGSIDAEIEIASADQTSYEGLAVRKFDGKTHFLEEGSDFMSLASLYGVRREIFAVLDLFRGSGLEVSSKIYSNYNGNPKKILDGLKSLLDVKKSLEPGYKDLDTNDIMIYYLAVMLQIKDKSSFQLIVDAGSIFGSYLAMIRDYETLGPNASLLCSTLKGKKAVIVGANHLDPLTRRLNGEEVTPPEKWPELLNGLKPEHRESIRNIEELIQRLSQL
ncbi:hypothetical protein HYS31_00285 [Candidatus Woesearchaeota archaeon]|nr:hypothetical protein [Candidatus Woesearchaeota archaeon]